MSDQTAAALVAEREDDERRKKIRDILNLIDNFYPEIRTSKRLAGDVEEFCEDLRERLLDTIAHIDVVDLIEEDIKETRASLEESKAVNAALREETFRIVDAILNHSDADLRDQLDKLRRFLEDPLRKYTSDAFMLAP